MNPPSSPPSSLSERIVWAADRKVSSNDQILYFPPTRQLSCVRVSLCSAPALNCPLACCYSLLLSPFVHWYYIRVLLVYIQLKVITTKCVACCSCFPRRLVISDRVSIPDPDCFVRVDPHLMRSICGEDIISSLAPAGNGHNTKNCSEAIAYYFRSPPLS